MRYYIIAGEASGDLHASNLMKALKRQDPAAEFRCWGGDLMKAQGGELVKHYRELAFMGFMEVILHLPTLLRNFNFCKQDIQKYQPDVIILIDYPGFNLRLAKFASAKGFRVYYYISPQLWAWHASRVKILKRFVNRMFVILPFEKEFYSRYEYPVDFVGHPLLDVIQDGETPPGKGEFLQKNELADQPIIALLPGSRKMEIEKMLRLMLAVKPFFKGYRFVVAAAPSIPAQFYASIIEDPDVKLVFDQTYPLLRSAEAALVTSGTATLETALLGCPQVVCYKGNPLSFLLARLLVHVKYISLVNLIMEKPLVKELIQGELTKENLIVELKKIVEDQEQRKILQDGYHDLKERLGGSGASDRTAILMQQYLGEKKV